jgi:hypothetical protein
MKLSLAFVALTGAVAPPRIELNLEGMTSAYKLNQAIYREHDIHGTAVTSRQDWTEKCAARRSCQNADCNLYNGAFPSQFVNTDQSNCPFPEAQGYDHQDKEVEVNTRIFLVDLNGVPQNVQHTRAQVSFDQRATYLFKYDATDAAGNHAEQVVFALILDDTEAPFFGEQCLNSYGNPAHSDSFHSAITVEAVSDWTLCELRAYDNVDEGSTQQISYDIDYLGRSTISGNEDIGFDPNAIHADAHNLAYADAKKYFTPSGSCSAIGTDDKADSLADSAVFKATSGNYHTGGNICGPEHVGKFLVTATVRDAAGVYGHNALNNTRKIEQAILVRDTHAPAIHLEGMSPSYVECRRPESSSGGRKTYDATSTAGQEQTGWDFEAWTGSESDCQDRLDTQALGRYLPVTTTLAQGNHEQVVKDASNVHRAGTQQEDKGYPNWGEPKQWLDQLSSTSTLLNTQKTIADQIAESYNGVPTSYTLKYTCADYSGNTSPEVTRTVITQDTHAPTLFLTHGAGANAGQHMTDVDTHQVIYQVTTDDASTTVDEDHTANGVHGGAYAADSCNAEVGVNGAYMSTSWGPRAFNAKQLGDYVRTYTASDKSGNKATKTRTYTVIDAAAPVIHKVAGTSNCAQGVNTYCASRDEEYTDTGATCHDFVDGELSHAVEVSGEVVNMRIPGTYQINYDCQDLSGNSAQQQTRTIVVKDFTNPELTLLGASVNYVEAGFPYVDAGATATDTLDGDITQYIWTDGNTVTTQEKFYNRKSCAGVIAGGGTQNGEYYITTQNTHGDRVRVLVHCLNTAQYASKTWKVHQANEAWDCADMGMTRYTGSNAPTFAGVGVVGDLDQYLCYMQTEDAGVDQWYGARGPEAVAMGWNDGTAFTRNGKQANQAAGGFQGKYIIHFNVEDKAGNQADSLSRTVIVKDTLPPVITLKLNKKLVHVGASNQYGLGGNGETNPAYMKYHHGDMKNPAGYYVGKNSNNNPGMYSTFGNPNIPQFDSNHATYSTNSHFMAESVTSNGWVIGAIASAVAGVALLGMSRKSAVTSVPV